MSDENKAIKGLEVAAPEIIRQLDLPKSLIEMTMDELYVFINQLKT
ncbi:hypothetical protein LL912_00710 [Niabella sp. CC-SYL272]|nr:hypothetical protein [Niabella agricola]MCF3107287.1 hypothetical protein [Niabella agricola]